jgi:hypothetical protein
MFQELNQLAMDEQTVTAEGKEINNDHNHDRDHDDLINRVYAELLLYKQEQHLPLKKEDGQYNNPLDWWCLKQQQYP